MNRRGTLLKNIKRVACCSFFLLSGLALAQSSLTERSSAPDYRIEYCQSKTPISTIDQALQCDYQSKYSPLVAGFNESARWIRIQIQGNQENQNVFEMDVGPYFLKNIQFFSNTNQGWVSEQAGSRPPEIQTHRDIGGYFFITPTTLSHSNTYYLKVQASSLTHIAISVTPFSNARQSSSERLLGLGAQLGVLAAILVFAIVSLSLNPTVVMARFSVSMANLLLCILSGSGILAIYLFKQQPLLNEMVFHWGLCLRLGLWVWASQAFLISYETPNWYKRSCWLLYGLVGTCLLLVAAEKPEITNPLMLLGVIAAPIIQIIAINRIPNIAKAFKTALISGFCVSILLIILAVVSVLFPLQNNSQIPVYLSRLTDFVNPLVMLSIIVFQNRLIRKELVEVKTALTESRLRSEFENKLLKDRRTLIDMLAHELKNPLASIGLAVDTLSKSLGTKNENDQQRLHNISRSILNMDAVIERCSLMNLIDQKSLPLRLSDINLKDFVHNLIENLACESGTEIDIDPHLRVRTDSQFLQIILTNLVENGLKYSPAKSKVKIKAEALLKPAGSHIGISVTNPIYSEYMPDPQSLFQRFYRHPLAQESRGSGLGLYICKELSSLLSGSIVYEHNHDSVSFIVELPQ